MKQQSQRQLRVGEQIRHVLTEALQKGVFLSNDGADTSQIQITEVRPSPDLKNATAFVHIMDGEDQKAITDELNAHRQFFQAHLGKTLTTKFTPRLTFKVDESFGEVSKIDSILQKIHETTGQG